MSSCPKRGSAQRNCCYGWMASNNATKGPDALIRNAALPSAVTPPAYLHNRRCNISVMIVRWFPDRRGVANSVAVSGNAIGQLVIVGLLAQSLVRFGWRVSYAALGLANLSILAPIAFAAVRAAPSQAARGKQPSSDNPATTEQAVIYGRFRCGRRGSCGYWAGSTRYAGSRTFSWQPMWWRSLWTLGSAR